MAFTIEELDLMLASLGLMDQVEAQDMMNLDNLRLSGQLMVGNATPEMVEAHFNEMHAKRERRYLAIILLRAKLAGAKLAVNAENVGVNAIYKEMGL